MTGVIQGSPPAAPAQPQRLAVGSEGLEPPPRDVIAAHAQHINVESLAAQVRAVEGLAEACLYEATLLIGRPPAAGDYQRYSDLTRSIQKLDRAIARFRREVWQVF